MTSQPDTMTTSAGSAGTTEHEGTLGSPKPPYQPPRITFQEPLEVMAVVCTPGKTNLGNCSRGPISS